MLLFKARPRDTCVTRQRVTNVYANNSLRRDCQQQCCRTMINKQPLLCHCTISIYERRRTADCDRGTVCYAYWVNRGNWPRRSLNCKYHLAMSHAHCTQHDFRKTVHLVIAYRYLHYIIIQDFAWPSPLSLPKCITSGYRIAAVR